MGKSQSKTLNSLVSTLGLSGADEKAKKTGRKTVTFRTHSSSLDSITTAVSCGTEHQSLSHSSSLDNLLHHHCSSSSSRKTDHAHNHTHPSQSSFRRRKENGGKVYDALMETSSIVTAFSDAVLENSAAQDFMGPSSPSSSSPQHHEIRTGHPEVQGLDVRGKEVDGFSDKFVLDCGGDGGVEAAAASGDKMHTGDPNSHLDQLNSPHLHPAIINKLSHEEWHELISYACATLGQTLLAAILEEIRGNHLLLQPPSTSPVMAGDSTPPSGEREGEEKTPVSQSDLGNMCTQSVEDLLRKLRDHRQHLSQQVSGGDGQAKDELAIERTASLPPLNLKQPLSGRHSAPTEGREHNNQSPGAEVGMHGRSKSHGESDYRHLRGEVAASGDISAGEDSCTAEVELDLGHHHSNKQQQRGKRRCGQQRCTCGENRNHLSSGHGRRRRGRSRSDGHRDSSLVDPSLDDDCPGVPENRVRRSPRYAHQHQHQHHVCKQCMMSRDVSSTCNRAKASGGGKKAWERRYSPDLQHTSARRYRDSSPPPPPPSLTPGPTLVVTLEDMRRTAAILKEKSTEFVEQYDSEEELGQVGGNHGDTVVKVTSCSNGEVKGHQVDVHDVDFSRNVPPYRSGRDSPATDMAVANLDLNSSKMLEPLQVSGSVEAIVTGGGGPVDMVRGHQLYLHSHNHHHYHHIIHHHSQP